MKLFLMISAIHIDRCLVQLSSERLPLAADTSMCRDPQTDMGCLPLELRGIPRKRRKKNCMSQKGWRLPREHGPRNQLSRARLSSQRWKWQAWVGPYMGLYQALCVLWLIAWWFCGTSNSGSGLSPTLFPALETVFFLLGCLVQPQYDDFWLVLLYLALFYLVVISWKPALF